MSGLVTVAGCDSRNATMDGMSRAEAYRRAKALAALGRKMFYDPSLSGSGRMSCASCHNPEQAFGPPHAFAVQSVPLGGKDLRQMGSRSVPSLRYLQAAPQFSERYFESDDEGDSSINNGPTGGLTWDGRVDRGRDQARLPLLSPYEMANDDPADIVTKVRKTAYAGELGEFLGRGGFDRTEQAFDVILQSLEAFEQDPAEFYPYSSKYDAYLAGKAELTAHERQGLSLFEDPGKGNCASCHRSRRGKNGTPPQFTDYGHIALGVPRNNAIPANVNPAYFDLGLCGPERTDLHGRAEYCGRFRTPSLRNVATRRMFFHNGVFHSLKEALEFYVQRDTDPARWYRRSADGRVDKFDDLPAAYRGNVNMDPPFGKRPGETPALSDPEIQDVIAFLQALTDGYRPAGSPSTPAKE
jgi:cytochrome c peroxidase